MLQQDPVCGTYVAIDSSLKKISDGRVMHFCSAECRDKYRAYRDSEDFKKLTPQRDKALKIIRSYVIEAAN